MSSSSSKWRWAKHTGLSVSHIVWAVAGIVLAAFIVKMITDALESMGVGKQGILFELLVDAGSYSLAIGIIILIPYLLRRRWTVSRAELGLDRGIQWKDVSFFFAGLVAYLVLTIAVSYLISWLDLFNFVDFTQKQDVGFSFLTSEFDYVFAFIALVVIGPFAEELIFRGYLLGKLRAHMPVWLAVVLSSLPFAALHLQWNVAIDVFVLAVVLATIRVMSGSLWPAILLHAAKNGVAFFFLFVYPLIS